MCCLFMVFLRARCVARYITQRQISLTYHFPHLSIVADRMTQLRLRPIRQEPACSSTRAWPVAEPGKPVAPESLTAVAGDEETRLSASHVLLPARRLRG